MGFFDSLINYAPYLDNALDRSGNRDYQQKLRALTLQNTEAKTKALSDPPTPVRYIQNGSGEWVAVPTKLSGSEMAGTPGAPHPSPAPNFSFEFPKTLSGALSPSQQPTQGPTAQQPRIGVSTGIQTPPKAPGRIDPLSSAGVDATVTKAERIAATKPQKPQPSEPLVKTVGPNGETIYTPRSKASGMAAPKPTTPPDRTLVQTQGDDGKVIYTPRPKAAGMAVPAKVGAAGGAGAAMSGQTMQTLGRLGMSFNDLKQAIDQMDQYENTPGNLAKQTPFKQAVGAAAEAHPSQEAHGLMGALNNGLGAFVGAKAQEKIGTDDPEYRTYLNNKQRVATAFTELLPRPNQQLLQLEKGLSGADVGWNPELIKNIQGRRRGGLDVLKNILQQQGMLDASGSMTGTKPTSGARGAAPNASGNIDLRAPSGGSAATPRQALSDVDKAHAARDPQFAAWLKSKGYEVP